MVFHELATNSAKHGALSADAGVLDLTGSSDDDAVTLVWAERMGPLIGEAPALADFGSKMVLIYLTGQVGGSIDYDWQPTGLLATVSMRVSMLAR